MISVGPTKANGLCPHHLLHVDYEITVAYIPTTAVIGLSKLSRVPKLIAAQPKLQEDVTQEIGDALKRLLGTSSIAVLVVGQHSCMRIRGVEEDGAVTTTSIMEGLFSSNDAGCKDEFFQIVDRNRR